MILSALFSFLGGSAFRMIWGEVSAWLTTRQDHEQELERIRLQGELDAAQHARNLEAMRLQSDLGVKTIQVQGDADLSLKEMDAWGKAVAGAVDPSDTTTVGQWVKAIRPAAATIALGLWALALYRAGFNMTDWDHELVGAVLGFFFADRSLVKSGKAG